MADVSANIAVIASDYDTIVEVISLPINDWGLMVEANPNRWYISFSPAFFPPHAGFIGPAPIQNGVTLAVDNIPEIERKYRDCPSIVTGEWYGVSAGGGSILVTQCIYKR
jgi:hypothetical protein